MRSVLAIAMLTVRSAFRSRAMLCLAVALVGVLFGLPKVIKADGTAAGEVRLMLQYVTALSFFIIGMAILWLGCGAVSEEIRDKQIHLLAVKPVRRAGIWAGKWVGLCMLGLMLAVFTGLTVWAGVRWRASRGDMPEEDRALLVQEILVGRSRVLPERRDITREVEERLRTLLQQGVLAPEFPRDRAEKLMRREILSHECSVDVGGTRVWRFDRGKSPGSCTDAMLRVKFHRMVRERAPAAGKWMVTTDDGKLIATSEMRNNVSGLYSFSLPVSLGAVRRFTVTFVNAPEKESCPVLFNTETGGVELLAKESSFEMNLARTVLVLFGYLVLVAALGVTTGSCFSFGVGAFTGISVVVASLMSLGLNQTVPLQNRGIGVPAFDPFVNIVLSCVETASRPVLSLDPIGLLADGMAVSWGHVGWALLILAALYPLVLGIIGVTVLVRRELALPES